jgi:hypothetical protein
MKNIKNQIKEIIREELNKIQENISLKWDTLSPEQQEDKLLSVYQDPDDALEYVGIKWDDLPDEVTNRLNSIKDDELNENEMDFNKGDIVKIDPLLDTDPYSKKGEEGIISDFDDEVVTIKFDDGVTGKYQWGTFSKVDIDEATAIITTKTGTKNIPFKNPSELNTLKADSNVTSIETTAGNKIKETKTSFTGRPITESLNDRFKKLLNS